MPKIDKLTAPEGTTLAKARVKTGQCVFRVDGELRPFETVFYRRHLLPVGETFRRSRHRAAEGLHDGHSARLHRDQRCRRQSHSQGRRGCPMNDVDRSNRRQQPATRVDPITGAVIQGALGEHRDRDGPQAHAHELFEHHPRIRGFRRGADRRRGTAIVRVQDEHAAAIGPDPRLCPRHPQTTRGARRRAPPRRRDHAQRSLWRRLARPRRGVLRAGVRRQRPDRLLGHHGAPSRHRRAYAGKLRHRRRGRRLRRGAAVQGDQGRRPGPSATMRCGTWCATTSASPTWLSAT